MVDAVPEEVLDALEEVRASGATNMLAREVVIGLIDDYEAEDWLVENKGRYMEALHKMGERRSE